MYNLISYNITICNVFLVKLVVSTRKFFQQAWKMILTPTFCLHIKH